MPETEISPVAVDLIRQNGLVYLKFPGGELVQWPHPLPEGAGDKVWVVLQAQAKTSTPPEIAKLVLREILQLE